MAELVYAYGSEPYPVRVESSSLSVPTMPFRDFFLGKKVTLMGLGLLGRGLGDAIFLAQHGAELIVTDLRDEKALAPSISKLQNLKISKSIQFVLGKHRLEDFRERDFILKAAGVPLDSPYIAEAKKYGIPIEMDASLFAKLMPKGVTLVGITGTRGKSTVTALIYEIVSRGSTLVGKKVEPRHIFKGGNLVPEATLPLLEKVKAGDIVVLELDSWQLQGFHDAKISPHVAVFTTFLDDHLAYYKGDTDRYFEDKVAIFKYQKSGDTLVTGEKVSELLSSRFDLGRKKGRTLVTTSAADVPADWKLKLLGEHNKENIAAACAAARALGVSGAVIKKSVERFKGVPGRLEYLRTVRLPAAHGGAQAGGVKIYNDNNATTPDATIAALKALGTRQEGARKIVLIMGGTDKVLGKHAVLVEAIPKYCKAVLLLKETGSKIIKPKLEALRLSSLQIKEADGLKACVEEAMKIAQKGDTILFSPAFASFGKWFKNEYDRGVQFLKVVEGL